jgi:hypothetical protein
MFTNIINTNHNIVTEGNSLSPCQKQIVMSHLSYVFHSFLNMSSKCYKTLVNCTASLRNPSVYLFITDLL